MLIGDGFVAKNAPRHDTQKAPVGLGTSASHVSLRAIFAKQSPRDMSSNTSLDLKS
jgi:hypothetical protein